MPWLRVLTQNGKVYYQIVHGYKKGSEYLLGQELYIDITETEAALGLNDLVLLYLARMNKETQAAGEATAERERAAQAHLVERIVRIIKESNQEGEVASAKGFYKKITGEDWRG